MNKPNLLLTATFGLVTLLGANFAAAQDYVYVTDSNSNSLSLITPTGSVTVLPTTSFLNDPTGITLDTTAGTAYYGDLFIANSGNNTIATYNPTTNTYATFASGTDLSGPRGLAFDSSGNLYVADSTSGDITKYTDTASTLSNTPGIYATSITNPKGIAIDGNGNLFVTISDHQVDEVVASSPTAGTVLPFYPGSTASNPTMSGAQGIVFGPQGDLYVVSSKVATNSPAVYQLTLFPQGSLYSYPSLAVGLNSPQGIVFDPTQNYIYIADNGNNTVTEYEDIAGSYQLVDTYPNTAFSGPSFLAVDTLGLAVPEPSTYAMLLGSLATLLFLHRRRNVALAKI